MGTAFCTKVDDLPGGAVCPGNFKLNCESDDVGENFTGDEDCPVSNLSLFILVCCPNKRGQRLREHGFSSCSL